MQQGDFATSYYQYYQNPNPDPTPNDPFPATYASAPPVPSCYSSSDYSNYDSSSTYPPYPQNPVRVTDPPPAAPVQLHDLTASQYPYLHNFQSYDQFQTLPNSGASSFSYDSLQENSLQFDHEPRYSDSYDGTKVELYGAREAGSETLNRLAFDDYGRPTEYKAFNRLEFDDYGRPINPSGPKHRAAPGATGANVKANPKTETPGDVKNAVQKFSVMLLADGGNQSDMDILCQIGLDGVQMLDPSSGRTLKIYPLETVTRWEVIDTALFSFWAKRSIDIEPRRIRLKSNGYTINAILDTLTAATAQLKEMSDRHLPSETSKTSDQSSEKKKGLADWMKLVKPSNEEKEHWVPDDAVNKCACGTYFGAFVRKHHCRNCGDIFCDKCTQGRIALTADEEAQPVRVCDQCMAEVTQRLNYTKEPSTKIAGIQSHEDLAKKLKEEIERTRESPSATYHMQSGHSGPGSDASEVQMREVACPTCTVHLQVDVPNSGSKTIECSLCQHPFLVNAR